MKDPINYEICQQSTANSESLCPSSACLNSSLDWFLLAFHLIDIPSYPVLCTLPVSHAVMVCHALNLCSISPFLCGLTSLPGICEWSHVLTQSSFQLPPSLLLGNIHSLSVMYLLKPLRQTHTMSMKRESLYLGKLNRISWNNSIK